MSIFVGNLPFRAEREDVLQLFTPFGEVTNCSLPLERDTGRKRGFAFIEMADEALESTAIESLQGTEMMGRPLRINKAEPRGNSPRRNYSNGNSRQYNGGGYNSAQNSGYRDNNTSYGYAGNSYNGDFSSTNNLGGGQNSNNTNRSSGAKGWEDRSYGNNSENSEYENGRSRRRRGGSNELDVNQEDS